MCQGWQYYKYVYQYKDHLGNNRLSFSDGDLDGSISPVNEILSNADYYVMGLTHAGETISGIASNYNYKYQGKEQLDFEGYNMYDFGSRMYDASVGRWFNIDPQNQFQSPFLAMGNNWVFSVDPNGELAWFVPVIIGAVVGGTSAALNPSADFGDILFGTIVGGLSGYIGAGVGSAVASSSGSVLYGAAAGGAAGGSFSGFGTSAYFGSDPFKGGLVGALSGGLGTGVGAYIGGSVGAFSSALTSSSVSSAFYGNFSLDNVLISGAFSVAAYNVSMYLSYNKDSGLTRKQHRVLSREAQIAFARNRERGGWITKDGIRVVRTKGSSRTIALGVNQEGDVGTYHFHPGNTNFDAEPSFNVDLKANGLNLEYSLAKGRGGDVNLILQRKEFKSYIISINKDIKYGVFDYQSDMSKFNNNLGEFYNATINSNYFSDNHSINLNLLKTFNAYNYLRK